MDFETLANGGQEKVRSENPLLGVDSREARRPRFAGQAQVGLLLRRLKTYSSLLTVQDS